MTDENYERGDYIGVAIYAEATANSPFEGNFNVVVEPDRYTAEVHDEAEGYVVSIELWDERRNADASITIDYPEFERLVEDVEAARRGA